MKANYNILIGMFMVILLISIFLFRPVGNDVEETDDVKDSEAEFDILVENLDTPWALDFLPSGEIIFTERAGRVSVYDGNEIKLIGEIEVSEVSESGLLGIAVDPDFELNNYVYVYYTHENGNRVSRFVLEDSLNDEFILLDNIPSARFHDGGRIKFGHDGKLYATTGDATIPSTAQDINSLAGKILRINKDGTIPKDNPFGNYVYSYGHRNPQGLAWNDKGELYASEHGPTSNDEINLIVKGGNYGWPIWCSDENADKEGRIVPIRCYDEFTLAPSGIAFHNKELYVAGLRGNQLRRISFENGKIINEEELFNDMGRIREAVSDGEYLYFATSNRDGRGNPNKGDDKIIRVKF